MEDTIKIQLQGGVKVGDYITLHMTEGRSHGGVVRELLDDCIVVENVEAFWKLQKDGHYSPDLAFHLVTIPYDLILYFVRMGG